MDFTIYFVKTPKYRTMFNLLIKKVQLCSLLILCQSFFPGYVLADSTSFIRTFLVYYTGAIAAEDIPKLAKYDVLDVNRRSYQNDAWASIKAINPDIEIYLYELGSETNVDQDDYGTVYLNSIARLNNARNHTMGSLDKDHPELFQKDASGNRIFNPAYPNSALMDFGSSDYQKYWIEAVSTDILNQSWKADGLHIDNCTADDGSGQNPFAGPRSVKYADAEKWNSAMNSFVNAISRYLHHKGQKVFPNRGNSRSEVGYAAWIALDASADPPDIVMEEGAFAVSWGGGDTQFYPEQDWKRQVDVIAALKNSRVALQSHTDLSQQNPSGTDNYGKSVTFWQTLWYSMCSYHLARNDAPNNALFMFRSTNYKTVWWFDEYNKIDLGRALTPYSVIEIGGTRVYSRKFEKGYIFVNPTTVDAIGVPLPKAGVVLTHENLDSDLSKESRVDKIDVKSHHGLITLFSNSNISPPANIKVDP